MRAEELAEILHAGWEAITGESEPAANALEIAHRPGRKAGTGQI